MPHTAMEHRWHGTPENPLGHISLPHLKFRVTTANPAKSALRKVPSINSLRVTTE